MNINVHNLLITPDLAELLKKKLDSGKGTACAAKEWVTKNDFRISDRYKLFITFPHSLKKSI